MRRALLLVLVTACGNGYGPFGQMEITVDRYDYTFDLESGDAHAALHVTVTTEGNCFDLPLRADLVGDVVLVNGEEYQADVDDGVLHACGIGHTRDEPLVIEADLHVAQTSLGGSQVGWSISTDATGAPFYYLVSWVGGCDQFAPCDHAPDRFARYHFDVTHPSDVTVLCPGTVEANATRTTCTFDLDGGPTYSTFGLVASSNWEVTELGDWNGIDVTLYNRGGTPIAAQIDGAWQTGFLAFLEARFGPYPYGAELRVVTGPTYWSGFEHPGNIVLDDGLRNSSSPMANTYADPLNHVLAHEIVHQWAGDETTLADTYDFVWKEAMAEYLAFVYEDESGRGVGTARLWPAFANGALYHPVPTDEPRPALFDYYGEVYGPGPMILFRQLEVLFTREQVLDAIAQVLGEPHALSVDELQAALEDTLDVDLDMYFDRWVRGAGAPAWPRFTVDVTGLDSTDVSVTVSQPAPYRGCAFTIRLRGADLADQHDLFFDFGLEGTESVTQAAQTTFVVTRYDFNAKGECLAFRATGAARAPLHERGWTPWRSLH